MVKAPPPTPRRGAWLDIALVGGWLVWLVSWAPHLWWPLEVTGNFPVQLAVGGLLLAAVAGWWRDPIRLALALGLTVVGGWPVDVWLTAPTPSVPPPEQPLVLSLHNVLRTNTTPERVIAEIDRWQPDLAILEETSSAWEPTLSQLDRGWPTSIHQPADHNFGIAARAKRPWDRAEVVHLVGPPAEDLPALELHLTHAGRPLRIFAVHLVPPVSGLAAKVRREQVDSLIEAVRARPEVPTLIIGDLNTSVFALTYRSLLQGTGLRDARTGFGLHPTWPARLPSWGRLSLDHVLVPPELEVRDVALGGLTGSDHRGLRVEVQWRSTDPS